MPGTNNHIGRAESNENFFRTFDLANTSYLDWAVTALFYAALHYVDACLHEHRTQSDPNGIEPSSHEHRTPAVHRNFPRIYSHYQELKQRSEDARYELKPFTPAQVIALERKLNAVRQFARSRLNLT